VGFPDRQGRSAPGGWDIGFTPSHGLGHLCTNPISVQVRIGSAPARRIVSYANEVFFSGRSVNELRQIQDFRN
jgi:hypothetical protein